MKKLMKNLKTVSEPTGGQMTLSFPVGFLNLANLTPLQEKEKAMRMTATSGQKCLELLERFNHVSSWAKMLLGYLVGMEGWYSTKLSLTWKMKDMKSKRFLFQLAPSTRHTEEIGCGLLLTPTTREQVQDLDKFKVRMEKYPNGTTMPNLATQVMGMLPTPNARDWKGAQGRSYKEISYDLPAIAKMIMLPTPMASDCGDKVTGLENQDSLTKLARNATGKTSQLNPLFVAEMMGFQKDWTVLPFQSGETKASKDTEMP